MSDGPRPTRASTGVTVEGLRWVVSWHYWGDPANWVEDDITLADGYDRYLVLSGDKWQTLLRPDVYQKIMEAVDEERP